MTGSKATDRADRVRELHQQLEHQVAELVTGEDWRRMLELAARFHQYSWGNLLLIATQRPDATRVAGFQTWKSLGRHVRKGERGIRILAPCRYKVETDDGEDAWRLSGFTAVSVFDISQTDGAELIDVAPQLLAGSGPAGVWDVLAKQVAAAGFMLIRCESADEIGGANGRTDYLARTVTVRADVSEAQAVKTLAHELAHVMLEHEAELSAGCRGRLEVEAESVAYIVCAHAGVASESYSLPYVARWAAGDPVVVRQTAQRVVKVAGAIIDALSGPEVAEVAA